MHRRESARPDPATDPRAEHYSMSLAIGQILFDQVARSSGDAVVAPGASCRSQLEDRPGFARPPHPVEYLAGTLP